LEKQGRLLPLVLRPGGPQGHGWISPQADADWEAALKAEAEAGSKAALKAEAGSKAS
jgi:hypothetical protein